jgi:DNA-directed RNA polymerase specialized sigma24 family protein
MPHALEGSRLDTLLTHLASDRERAGTRYVQLRHRLVSVFVHRGCAEPEELADETLDRVAARLSDAALPPGAEPTAYAFGIAWNVARESFHHARTVPLPDDWDPPDPSADDDRGEQCLDRCLSTVPERVRELVLEYYQDDRGEKIRHRTRIAWRLGLTRTALRVRIHRITLTLRACVFRCMDEDVA